MDCGKTKTQFSDSLFKTLDFEISEIMPLSELEKKLYRENNQELNKKMLPQDRLKFGKQQKEKSEEWIDNFNRSKQEDKKASQILISPMRKKRRKMMITSLIAGVFIAGIAIGIFFIFQNFFKSEDFAFDFKVPQRIANGEVVNYEITYENKSKRILDNIEILIISESGAYFPDEEKIMSSFSFGLGALKPGERKIIKIPIQFFGFKGDRKQVDISFSFEAEGEQGRFQKKISQDHEIAFSSLSIVARLPEKVFSGETFTLELIYFNDSEFSFPASSLSAQFPVGFELIVSEPELKEGNILDLNEIKPKSEGKLSLQGFARGQLRDVKGFEFELFLTENSLIKIGREIVSTLIDQPPLSFDFVINDQKQDSPLNFGSNVRVKLPFENNTTQSIRNIFIELQIQSEAINWNTLKVSKGSFSLNEKLIRWDPSTVSNLALLSPGKKSEVFFDFQLLSQPIIKTPNDKNFIIALKASISSESVSGGPDSRTVEAISEKVVKLNSIVNLTAQGLYSKGPFVNFGPIPPKAGQETSYTLNWQLTNLSNEARNVQITAILPPQTRWLNQAQATKGTILFNDIRKEIRWLVPVLENGRGIISSPEEAFIQIGVTPSPVNMGQPIRILEISVLTAEDVFTGALLEDSFQEINSVLTSDPVVGSRGGIVIE